MGIGTALEKIRFAGSKWRYSLWLWGDVGSDNRPVIVVAADLDHIQDPATGTGECRSAALIGACCSALGVKDMAICFVHELLGTPKEQKSKSDEEMLATLQWALGGCDVILLGSELANTVTRLSLKLLTEKEPELGIACSYTKPDHNHQIEYKGRLYPTEYVTGVKRSPFSMEADYGVFLVRPNCFSSNENGGRIFIFSGAHGYGTQAAAEIFFCPNGAAQIAEKFRPEEKRHDPTWRSNVTGLIKVISGEKSFGMKGLGVPLTKRRRTISILQPDRLRGIEMPNPVLTPTLFQINEYKTWGIWRNFLFWPPEIAAAFTVIAGLGCRNWWMVGAGIFFYIICRFVHDKNRV